MINDESSDDDFEPTTTTTATFSGSNSLGNSLLLVSLLRQSLAKRVPETEFELDPLPERDERFWDSANDISIHSLGQLSNHYAIKDELPKDSNNNACSSKVTTETDQQGSEEPGPKNPGFLSSPFNRRRGGQGRVNPHLFSSLYHRGRSKFSAAELDDVTLDLASGELVKTGDGTLIGRKDIVRVTPNNREDPEFDPSPSSSTSFMPNLLPPVLYSGLETKKVGDDDEELSPRSSTSTTTESTSSFASSTHNGTGTKGSIPNSHFRRESRGSQTAEDEQDRAQPLTSPSKTLFGKVKQMSKNQKRKFSFSSTKHRKDSEGSTIEDHLPRELETSNGEDEIRNNPRNTGTSSAAIDIIGTPASCGSSEEELSSIPNSTGRSSLDMDEYVGPFVGRAVAKVDCVSCPYDRHALSYKKGDLVEIIQKRPTGSWIGKVNNKIGSFKFINVQLLPDEDEFDENDIDDNYTEEREEEHSHSPGSGDYRASSSYNNAYHSNARRRTKRLTPLTAWEMEQRQTVANVINGIRQENAALQQQKEQQEQQQQQQAESLQSLDSESPFLVQNTGRKWSGSTSTGGTGRRKSSSSSSKKGRPKSVRDLLTRINLEQHISVFILHGFDSLDIFKEMEEEDLDRLAILNQADRRKILTAVELLREYATGDQIPPIIIPTYSSSSQMNLLDDVQDHLNHILEPPPNFSRNGQAKVVRDSGVFLKCEEQEQEDPEIEEIILSPSNLPMTSLNLNPSDSQILAGRSMGIASLEEHYGEVRQRFLQAKSLFETAEANPGSKSNANQTNGENGKNQFLYCEKSSDSGISLGANSPPPNRYD